MILPLLYVHLVGYITRHWVFEKALDYHTQTLIIHLKIGDKQRITYSYNSIGIIHDGKGDNTLALFFFKKSLKLIKILIIW